MLMLFFVTEDCLMKSQISILEYCAVAPAKGGRTKWNFKFRSADGQVLVASRALFDSVRKAERGFISFVKAIAGNQYRINSPGQKANTRSQPGVPIKGSAADKRPQQGPLRSSRNLNGNVHGVG
jgi:hypothetical protein